MKNDTWVIDEYTEPDDADVGAKPDKREEFTSFSEAKLAWNNRIPVVGKSFYLGRLNRGNPDDLVTMDCK